jgi:hypothetical protein
MTGFVIQLDTKPEAPCNGKFNTNNGQPRILARAPRADKS